MGLPMSIPDGQIAALKLAIRYDKLKKNFQAVLALAWQQLLKKIRD